MVGSLARELSHLGPMADGTAERGEYAGVPRRPGAVETPAQELSHPEPMAGITAEPDEYIAVPRRPDTVEAPDEELSQSEPMPAITAEQGKRRSKERKRLSSAGFSAGPTRPMVEMSALIRGVTPRHNLEIGVKCPISIAEPRTSATPGTGRNRGRRKQRRQAACAPVGRE